MMPRKAQSSGVGESKPHIAEPGTFEGNIDYSKLTLGGQPIPPHQWGLIPYAATDQGREEANAGKEPPRVQILRTEESKRIERFADFQFDGAGPGVADPMKELVDKHVKPGEHPRFLSERSFPVHGTRGYEKVLDEGGKPVKFGDMWLGVIPQQEADRRQRRDESISKELMVKAQDNVREQNENVMSERDLRSLAKRRGVADDVGGMQSEDVAEHEFVI